MKNRLIRSILMTLLCAALALGCLAVSAAGEGTITTWAELQSAINDGGTVQLTGDVAARTGDSALTVPTGQTAVLDLKGHTITGPQGSGAIINNGTLTIRDSGTFLSGNIIGRCTSTDANAGVIVNNGTLTLENGIITNYPQTTEAENLSSGVFVLSGSFTMEGGLIRQCPGFGVSVGEGSFTMTGGRISENGNDGVYINSKNAVFTMSGENSIITGNTGNGVNLYQGSFTLVNGTISSNSGNGVRACDQFTMSNAQISGNTQNGVLMGAGGVFTMNSGSILLNQKNGVELSDGSNARMTMVDGVIRNNKGRGIAINTGTAVSMGGGIITANEGYGVSVNNGTFTNAGGYITDNMADGVHLFSGEFDMVTGSITGNYNNGVSVDAGLFSMESGFISENRGNGIRFGSSDPFAEGTSVTGYLAGGVIEGNTVNGVDILANGFVMNGGTITGNSSCGVHVHANADFTMTGGTVTENDGGVVPESGSRLILSGSPVISGNTIVVNRKTVPLNTDLRGGKIITISDMLLPEACVGVSHDSSTGVFTNGLSGKGGAENFFCDDSNFGVMTDANGEAKIIQAFSAFQARINAAKNGETIKLYNDVIAQPGEECLKIELKSLILDLNGHTLNRNLNEPGGNNGSVIRVESGASLQIKDSSTYGRGLITGGWAVNGGGIYNAGTLTMTGGTVAGNKATGNGGGVYVYKSAVLNVSGKPMVYDNQQTDGTKDSNIYLDGSAVIHVTAALTDGALLRVSRPGITGIITSGYNEKNPGKAPASFFDPDYPGYRVTLAGNEVSVEQDSGESAEYVESVAYNVYSWEGSLKKTQVTDTHVPVFPKATDVPNGKYVVNRDITINSRVYLRSDTEIILMNGCTLDVKGLYIPYEATLTIYGQDDNTGNLVARASGNGAGIGAADAGKPGGRIIIHGGKVTAEGSKYSAGIGSSDGEAACGDIIIYDGTVTATGGEDGAGIGGGRACNGKRILIYGGDITANGGKHAAGIGGGAGIVESMPVRVTGGAAGTIEIRGGRITAVGGENGAGIGGGDNGNAGSITIRGGTVNASGGQWGAGIGCGRGIAKKQTDETLDFRGTGRGGTVTIYGGTVTATGGEFGSGIGGGSKNWCRTIDIHGGTVTALGGTNGNGIGPGSYGDYESADPDGAETRESRTITISGGRITATGGHGTTRRPDGSGIGGNTFYNGYRDKVPITLTYQGNPGQSSIRIQASSYCGDVTLKNPFRNTNAYFTVATYQQENTGIMSSSPLIAWDGYTCDDGDYVTVIDWKNAREQLQLGNNIQLLTDITAAETDEYLNVPSGMKVQLDLNGYTLSRGRVYSTYNDTSCTDGFVIRNQGQLFITDSSEGKTGTITGGGNTGSTLKGGGICNEGLLVMTGGTVTGNYSLYGGGGIHNTGSMNLTGVRVTGNQGGHGGGICNEGAMNVSGFLQVNDNSGVADYSKGINVSGNEPIHIMGALSEDTLLHITPSSSATTVITSGLSGNGSLDNFETNGSYVLGLNSDGEAIIGEGAKLTFVTPEGETAHEEIVVAMDSQISLPECDEDCVPEGNRFRCWEIINDDRSVTPLQDGTLTVKGSTTLTAVWYYQEAADWYTLQLRLSEGCYVTMTKDISISYYDRFLKAVISRDAALDMNGHNLNGYSGPVFDITENGSLEIRNSGAQSVRMKAMYGTSLIVSRGHLVLEDNIQLSSDNSSYSDAVISALKGTLEIGGNVSVLQGPEGGTAIAISSKDNDAVAVTINTTGEVDGRIAVYPTNASTLNSSLTITNIHSTAAAANEYTPGGITAPLRAANVAEKINVSGGTWSAFLVDSYCAEGMVSVRMADGTYRILPADDSRIAAMNGSAIPNRYESLQDCVDLTHQPVQQPEIILLNDISLNGPVTVNRSSNILLDLNGHTISGTGAIHNKMTENPNTGLPYVLTVRDSAGGGSFALKADPGSTTYLGDLHAEERKDSFTLSGMDTVDGTPAATVIATDDFAANNQISGWLWEDDNIVADDAKRLCRAIATLTRDGQTTTHASIEDAVSQAEAGEGGDIHLLQDTALSDTNYLTKKINIILDGHTLSTGRYTIYARDGGEVTFSDGIVESTLSSGHCIAATRGSVTLADGLTVNGRVAAANASSLRITGANVRTQTGEAVLLLSNSDPVTFEMTSGSVTSGSNAAIKIQNMANLIIRGGTISSNSTNTNPEYNAAICTSENSNIAMEIYGGEITSAVGPAVSVSGARSVAVYGGTLSGDLNILSGGAQPAALNMSAGTIYGNVSLNSGTGYIYGGEIHGGVGARGARLSVEGGRYGIDPSAYVADGFVVDPPDQTDNMYRVRRADEPGPGSTLIVTFEPDNGGDSFAVTVSYGDAVSRPETEPTRTGYTFLGWFPVTGGTPAETAYDFSMQVKADLVLRAGWKAVNTYTVTFESDGGTEVPAQTVLSRAQAVEPGDPAKEGCDFLGWYLVTDGMPAADPYDFSTPVIADITLRAQWKAIPEIRYTVTFDPDNGEASFEQTVASGGKAVVPAVPEKENCLFLGWYPVDDQGEMQETQYDFSAPVNKDLTLRAKWAEKDPLKWTVIFDSGYSNDPDHPEYTFVWSMTPVSNGEKAAQPVTSPTRDGYTFTGWYLLENGETADAPFDFEGTPIYNDVTLRAKWTEMMKYTVTFDSNGGSPQPEPQQVYEGDTATRPEDPKKDEYTFEGWYLGENLYDFTAKVNGAITLTAHWNEIQKYTVTFNPDNGSDSFTQAVVSGEKAVKPAVNPTKTAHVFLGWYQMAGDTMADDPFDFSTAVTGPITLKAKWGMIQTYTITFNSDGGTPTPGRQTIIAGYAAVKPADPVKEGSVFAGWYPVKKDGSTDDTAYDFSAPVNADVSLKAKWAAAYTITAQELPEYASWQDVPQHGAAGASIQAMIRITPAAWNAGERVEAIIITDTAQGDQTVITETILGTALVDMPAFPDDQGNLVVLPKAFTMPASNVTLSARFTTIEVPLKAITATAEGFAGLYDGQPHGITVTVTDPAEGAVVKYGRTADDCTLDESPVITDPAESPLTVWYQITADGYETAAGFAQVEISKSGSPAAPEGITTTAPTAAGANDGKIAGVAPGMEYRKAGTQTWNDVTGNEITGLAPGTYFVRVKATDTHDAGAMAEVTVPEPEPAPDPKPDPEPAPKPAPPTPEQKVLAFVTRCYKLILNREPEAGGLQYWSSKLLSKENCAAEVIYGFLTSKEYKNRNVSKSQEVEILYRTMLDRPSEPAGKEYWMAMEAAGYPKSSLVNGFSSSREFRNLCNEYGIIAGSVPEDPSAKNLVPVANYTKVMAFVTRCYRLILQREPDEGGLEYWSNKLARKEKTAAEVIYGFLTSREYQRRNVSDRREIEILYRTMLDRMPEEAGMAYWMEKQNAGTPLPALVNGFTTSTEFKRLCAEYAIIPGTVPYNPEDPNPANPERIRAFVTRCYEQFLGRTPDEGGLDWWSAQLAERKTTAAEAIRGFMTSDEFMRRYVSRQGKIEILYRVMLDREADEGGLAYWLGRLEAGEPMSVVLNGFAGSKEFIILCGKCGMLPGSVPEEWDDPDPIPAAEGVAEKPQEETPAEPEAAEEPAEPEPEKPEEPEPPAEPEDPEEPVTPAKPEEPEEPEVPAEPAEPEEPEEPVPPAEPEEPEEPETPAEPEEPEEPVTPAEPDTPAESETPEDGEAPEADPPAEPETPAEGGETPAEENDETDPGENTGEPHE